MYMPDKVWPSLVLSPYSNVVGSDISIDIDFVPVSAMVPTVAACCKSQCAQQSSNSIVSSRPCKVHATVQTILPFVTGGQPSAELHWLELQVLSIHSVSISL